MVTLPCGYITSEEIIRKFSIFYQEINHKPSLETEELNLAFVNNHVQLEVIGKKINCSFLKDF